MILGPDLAFHSLIDKASELPGQTVNNVFADNPRWPVDLPR